MKIKKTMLMKFFDLDV